MKIMHYLAVLFLVGMHSHLYPAQKQNVQVAQIIKLPPQQQLDLLSALPNEVQLIIFEALLSNQETFEDFLRDLSTYSRISSQFYEIAHSVPGQRIINRHALPFSSTKIR